jgi:ABC-2 type transport system ATP-binding protein
MTILSVTNLKKSYGKNPPFVAVDEISFSMHSGEILGLLGPNGSGKTTTIQMLLGTLSYTSGSIHYFGKDFEKHRSDILKQIAFASTYNSLPYILTIEENLEIFGRFHGLHPKETIRRTNPLLERFALSNKKKQRISSLSAGQVTRLMLVKAFFIEPKIVLLDEPTASLDPDVAMDVCQFIAEKRNQLGTTVLFTSHKMAEVTELCDRAIFLKNGKIIANDCPKNLAKSISSHNLFMTVTDGLKQVNTILKEHNLQHTIEQQSVQIKLDEESISSFLTALVRAEVSYTNIRIAEPSLDDYFKNLARKP